MTQFSDIFLILGLLKKNAKECKESNIPFLISTYVDFVWGKNWPRQSPAFRAIDR